jgi:hypothetical protein
MLKNPAAKFFPQQPKSGNQFGAVMHKGFIARALTEAFDQSVEIALLLICKPQLYRHDLTHDPVELDFGIQVGEEIDLQIKKLRDGFLAAKSGQQ